MRCALRMLFVVVGMLLASGPGLAAQDTLPPWLGGLTRSLGQPPRRHWYASGGLGFQWGHGSQSGPAVVGGFGLSHDLANPVTGLVAGSLEAFISARGSVLDGGARGLLSSTVLRLSMGAEYEARARRVSPFLGITIPVRRGGVFGAGTMLRMDWVNSRPDVVRMAVLVPVAEPRAGRTRPRSDRIDVPVRMSAQLRRPQTAPELDSALANIRAAVERIHDLVVPALDVAGKDPVQAMAPVVERLRARPPFALPSGSRGLHVDAIVRFYHAELARAFSIAAAGRGLATGVTTAQGDSLAARARTVLLDHTLFPFNRLLGQAKTPATLQGLSVHARGTFARELMAMRQLPPEREAAVQFVFQELLNSIEAVRRRAHETWRDSRLVWLPLQFGLLPEQHDTQTELDSLVERAVGQSFTDGNNVWYVINEQFQAEVTRSIHAAREYHVLWIHDFRGRNALGEPDAQSLRYVVDAYLHALTERVRDYDAKRVLPVYMVFLDQHYYEANRARLWLDFLEHPLDNLPQLAPAFAGFKAQVRQAQLELRQAVTESRLLQAEARQYGSAWLRNQLKVHVNITNIADASFRSRGVMPALGIPDNVMRDHRKIVFYDITEEDPYRGLAIYTGMGVGEHYGGPTWEDRAIMAQGPVVLSLKEQARRLLLSQGLPRDQIPFPLRPRPKAADYDTRVAAEVARHAVVGQDLQRAMELHNGTGFADKPINVAKATLYTLMPPGSVIKVPDSLWGSSLYAALLCGSAFRGVRVLFIAPSLESAPSAGWPAMAVAHDLFARLIVLQRALGPELEAVGGLIKTGIYSPGIGVQDVGRRFEAAYRNARRTPFLRRLFPVDPSVDTIFVHLAAVLSQEGLALPTAGVPPRAVAPKLHLKANFFATREGWDSLVARPEMALVLKGYLLHWSGIGVRQAAESLSQASQQLVDAFRGVLTPQQRDRVAYYLMVGSANQDYRSMFMDGEATMLMAGWSGVVGLIDFGLIANLSVWVDDLEMLDQLLPPPSGFQRGVARWLRPLL